MSRIACICFALALLPFATSAATAQPQPKGPPPWASTAASTLSPVDYNFVAQANLGAPFQVESGRIAETKATTAGIRDYAHLMIMTHIPIVIGSPAQAGTMRACRCGTAAGTHLGFDRRYPPATE